VCGRAKAQVALCEQIPRRPVGCGGPRATDYIRAEPRVPVSGGSGYRAMADLSSFGVIGVHLSQKAEKFPPLFRNREMIFHITPLKLH
jgi:hypothetical protein